MWACSLTKYEEMKFFDINASLNGFVDIARFHRFLNENVASDDALIHDYPKKFAAGWGFGHLILLKFLLTMCAYRSEIWWAMRDWIRDEACLADAPPRAKEMLPGDLTAPKYEQRSDGRLKLEAKKDMKRRLGRSPDDGDALALALAHRKQRPVPRIFVI